MIFRFTQSRQDSGRRSVLARIGPARSLQAGTAAIMVALLVLVGCSPGDKTPNTPPNRVLQSVDVQMTPDGTTTAIDGTAVSVRENASDATTQSTTYSPRDVADDLPVRVTTAYRTADRTGTDLADLAGYSGRVEIDLTVQNLTMRPQNLTYDVAGTSRSQPALVGSPLTVVASTSLPKTTPTDVITASASGDDNATNGVLSQSEDGGSVVQWAALLASPQMGTNATLRLVTDAKDFQVPAFDLSVQPGLVTDPSVSGVLESAFNSNPSSQLALEQRTIKVITDVNQVLTRASNNISSVRKNLDSTSETLGKRSVEELKNSTKGVTRSMKDLDKELKSLDSDISSNLDESQSAILSELSDTVSTMDKMLGDTSGGPPAPKLDGQGCKTVVQSPDEASSVYGNLMQVTAQLDGYATATDQCKKNAQQALARSVGPEKPSAEACEDKPSTTCSLFYTEQKFGAIMDDLVAKGENLVDSLQPKVITDTKTQYAGMTKQIDAADKAVQTLKKFDPHEDMDSRLAKTQDQLDVVDGQVDQLVDQVTLIHNDAKEAAETARTNAGLAEDRSDDAHVEITQIHEDVKALSDQNERVADNVCEYGEKQILDKGLNPHQSRVLRSDLVGQACPDEDGNEGANLSDDSISDKLDALEDHQVAMWTDVADDWDKEAAKWTAEAETWDDIADRTDVKNTDSGTGKEISDIRNQLNLARSRVKSVEAAVVTGRDGYQDRFGALEDSMKALHDHNAALGTDLTALQKWQQRLATGIPDAFEDAADQANDQVSDAIDPQIRKVTTQAEVDSKAVGEMFDESAAGLSNAADKITKNGTRTIDKQRRELAESEKRTSGAAKKRVDASLKQMAKGVSASSRDMNGASAQLTESLKKVLLDLGTRKVKGSGLLGAMTTSSAKVGTADYQLALASETTTSYAGVRGEDVNGILLRQAQLQAALQAGAELPAFHLNVPDGAESQTVYTFRIGGKQ
ncbi:coiled-coil domain-containing protein [Microlunatus soli]|uniref:Uncharacterized protein n=1 Tax=Microlunatus soli TaxID=630515 RepID=A0A1H1XCE9_9ACTN|nr:hypothetical protein [Microlunatus soli]SDT06832.1 hypothetical protein SAMN04489812_4019 [Microlunatus soli]